MNKTLLFNKYLGLWQKVGDFQRKRESVHGAKRNTLYKLSKEEENKVRGFFKPYTPINTIFHSFYTEKTGIFDMRYIPDDIYYTKVDTFFNDWNAAKVVDNKCYYENLFSTVQEGIKHPYTFLRRINGVWLDETWRLIDFTSVLSLVGK